jgi:uncharacterized phiE125 gp8 family phage protein
MTLKLITAPASEPVSLDEAKAQCKVEHSADDALFAVLIQSARETAEHITGRAFVSQTWEQVLDAFPVAEIELPKPRAISIVSVKYLDVDGNEQTIDSADYALDPDNSPGWLLPAVGFTWPATQAAANTVRVRFTAGYGNAAAVPAGIKQWMLLQIAAAYRNREAFAAGITVAELPNRFVDALLDRERTYL